MALAACVLWLAAFELLPWLHVATHRQAVAHRHEASGATVFEPGAEEVAPLRVPPPGHHHPDVAPTASEDSGLDDALALDPAYLGFDATLASDEGDAVWLNAAYLGFDVDVRAPRGPPAADHDHDHDHDQIADAGAADRDHDHDAPPGPPTEPDACVRLATALAHGQHSLAHHGVAVVPPAAVVTTPLPVDRRPSYVLAQRAVAPRSSSPRRAVARGPPVPTHG